LRFNSATSRRSTTADYSRIRPSPAEIEAARQQAIAASKAKYEQDEIFFHRLDDDGAVHFTAYPIMPVKR
jgi:hypothetical protein